MWSYACTDIALIEEAGKNEHEEYVAPDDELIEVDVVPGTYTIKHYDPFFADCEKDPNIWTIITKD